MRPVPVMRCAVVVVVLCAGAVWTSASDRVPLVGVAANGATPSSVNLKGAPPTVPLPKPPPTVEFIGDSTALATGAGVNDWAFDTKTMRVLGWSSDANHWLGCGVVQAGFVRYGGEISAAAHECGDIDQEWADDLDVTRPNAVVLQFGPWDVADHLLPGDVVWRGPGDPIYDSQLFAAKVAITKVSLERHITTIWLTSPQIVVPGVGVPVGTPLPEDEPARMNRFNQQLRTLARQEPGVQIIDLAGFVKRWPGGEADPTLRPDGIHFTFASARLVANWLGPEILGVLRHSVRNSSQHQGLSPTAEPARWGGRSASPRSGPGHRARRGV